MLQKSRRQEALLNLISAERIASQTELAERLKSRDIAATQASISRDLEELGVIKAGGAYRLPKKERGESPFGILSMDTAGESLIVAKCASGLASAVTVRIDAAKLPEVVGTIAGDDTIFIAVKDAAAQRPTMKKIWTMFEGQGGQL